MNKRSCVLTETHLLRIAVRSSIVTVLQCAGQSHAPTGLEYSRTGELHGCVSTCSFMASLQRQWHLSSGRQRVSASCNMMTISPPLLAHDHHDATMWTTQ